MLNPTVAVALPDLRRIHVHGQYCFLRVGHDDGRWTMDRTDERTNERQESQAVGTRPSLPSRPSVVSSSPSSSASDTLKGSHTYSAARRPEALIPFSDSKSRERVPVTLAGVHCVSVLDRT
ncbi:hypothetical protein EW146_g7703 [Bondarzewia mesenterica]|uniref:Uncharacterized protein n=1 Tax=Bondarzewia mesenterica TaxID=1095465 RepID=A0A4S4LK19_9AGAM|nr:hypothetical protein EW146_g7703 [Bondarzewia mesenterica]